MVELFFEEIKKALEQSEPVKITGFGKFAVHSKSGPSWKKPKTGEDISITPRRVMTFRAGQKLKAHVCQSASN